MTATAPTDAGALREALAIEDDAFHHEYRRARETGDMDGAARALSGRLRQMDRRAKAANARADRAEAALKDFVSVFEGVDTALSLAQEYAYLRAVDFLDGAQIANAARATTDADLAKARDRIAGLEAALSSILPGKLCGEISGVPDESRTTISITFGQIRTARAALTHGGDRGEN